MSYPHPVPALLIEKAEAALAALFVTKCATVMTVFLIVYDMIINFSWEVEFVWGNHWSLSKLIFLTNRFLALTGFGFHICIQFVNNPSDKFCKIAQPIDLVIGTSITSILTMVLVTRVWALYGRTRKVLAIIGASYVILLFPAAVFVIRKVIRLYNETDHQVVHDLDNLFEGSSELVGYIYTGCQFPWYPSNIWIMFTCSLIWESVMLGAMTWKAFSVINLKKGVVQYLYRDGLVYYLAMFMTLLTSIIFSSGVAGLYPSAVVSSGYMTGIKSVLCSHLLLRLKGFLTAPISETLEMSNNFLYSEAPNTTIRFAAWSGDEDLDSTIQTHQPDVKPKNTKSQNNNENYPLRVLEQDQEV